MGFGVQSRKDDEVVEVGEVEGRGDAVREQNGKTTEILKGRGGLDIILPGAPQSKGDLSKSGEGEGQAEIR